MSDTTAMLSVRPILKRGMLVAAANWQVTAIQSAADSIFKLLIAVPTVGGVVFMALMIGAEPEGLLSMEARDLLATVVAALLSQPLVLAAFGLSLTVVIGGGSAFMFLVKGGTIATLVEGERMPEAPHSHDEHDPLARIAATAAFGVDRFFDDCRRFFGRYTRLGLLLFAVYAVSAGVFLAVGVALTDRGGLVTGAALSAVFVAWVTLVNLVYLLLQIIIVADDCQVGTAVRRMAGAARGEWRMVAWIFIVVLGIVAAGTVISIVAMGALSLIAFVPLVGLTVLPLQVAAWLFRSLVFQFIELSAVGAYANRFRAAQSPPTAEDLPFTAREAAGAQGAQ